MDEKSTARQDASEYDRNRLPTLMEVLSRRTLPPVDLYSFYIYMRDQQQSVDYLDFWLDVSQHLSLCRHYVRELRRSVLVETPELDKAANSKRSSQILDSFDLGESGPAASISSERSRVQRLSHYLRNDSTSRLSKNSNESRASRRSSPSHAQARGARYMSSNLAGGNGSQTSREGESTPQHTVARADIRASAEKILYTFLLAGSEREIILPHGILSQITEAIEEHGRDDPEVFDAAKDYVFQAMERDAFPGFLRAKALGNLVPLSLMLRLIIGLLAIFGAFWTSFILIFLDKSRQTRCWIILPFAVGVYALASHQYSLDPILALAGVSEYTFFSFKRVHEPYVRNLLSKRGMMVSMWIILIVVALVCLFVFVPGKRL